MKFATLASVHSTVWTPASAVEEVPHPLVFDRERDEYNLLVGHDYSPIAARA